MVRIAKNPEERKTKILESAVKLFKEKGYEHTVVSDIVKEAGIAQGTFYLYYKSKDDIFVAVLEHFQESMIEELVQIQERTDLNPVQKLNYLTSLEFTLNREQDDLVLQMHLEKNAGIHQRYLIRTINRLTPIYASIIEEGIKEGFFHTQYPKESAEYMLVATKFLFDPGIFPHDIESLQNKIKAALDISEKILGAPKGSMMAPDVTDILEWRTDNEGNI